MACTHRSLADGIYLVPPHEVAAIWEDVAPLLAKAVARAEGRASLHKCYDDCVTGERLLWVAIRDSRILLTAVTSVQEFPGRTYLRIDQCGGSCLREFLAKGLLAFKEWAKAHGCNGVLLDGRRGWSRLLKARIVSVRMEIDL